MARFFAPPPLRWHCAGTREREKVHDDCRSRCSKELRLCLEPSANDTFAGGDVGWQSLRTKAEAFIQPPLTSLDGKKSPCFGLVGKMCDFLFVYSWLQSFPVWLTVISYLFCNTAVIEQPRRSFVLFYDGDMFSVMSCPSCKSQGIIMSCKLQYGTEKMIKLLEFYLLHFHTGGKFQVNISFFFSLSLLGPPTLVDPAF